MDLWEIRMGVIAHLGVNVTKTTTFSFYIFYFARQIKSEFGIFLGVIFYVADSQTAKSNAVCYGCNLHGVANRRFRRSVFAPAKHFSVLT